MTSGNVIKLDLKKKLTPLTATRVTKERFSLVEILLYGLIYGFASLDSFASLRTNSNIFSVVKFIQYKVAIQ